MEKKLERKFNEQLNAVSEQLTEMSASTVEGIVALESFDDSNDIGLEASGIKDNLRGTLAGKDNREELNVALEAATLASVFRDPTALKKVTTQSGKVANALESGVVSGVEKPLYALEQYEPQHNTDLGRTAIMYNYATAQTDEVTAAVFPLQPCPVSSPGFAQEVRIKKVYNNTLNSEDGSVTDYQERNVLDAYQDSSIISNDLLKIIPIVRPSSEDFFEITDIAARDVMIAGKAEKTSPLKFGKEVNIRGLSQTDVALTKGIMDRTDTISNAVSLEAVYIKVGNDVIKLNCGGYLGFNFVFDPQGTPQRRILNVNSNDITLNENIQHVDGSTALVDLKPIIDNNLVVSLKVVATGDIELQDGKLLVNLGLLDVAQVMKDGVVLPLDVGQGKAIRDLFATAEFLGYDINANRTNTNKRTQGQLVHGTPFVQTHVIPFRDTYATLSPATNEITNKEAIDDLVSLSKARIAGDTIDTLHYMSEILSQHSNVSVGGDKSGVLGIASLLVNASYFSKNITTASINSVRSKDRREDVQATIAAEITWHVQSMLQESNLRTVVRDTYGLENCTITAVVVTSDLMRGYTMLDTTTRIAGLDVKTEVVSSVNKRMKDQMFVVLRVDTPDGTTILSPGVTPYVPTAPTNLNIDRNGQTSNELTVNPRFTTVVNMPVMTHLQWPDLEDTLKKF